MDFKEGLNNLKYDILLNTTNVSKTDIFEKIMEKFKIDYNDVFSILDEVKKFEKDRNLFESKDNEEYKRYYKNETSESTDNEREKSCINKIEKLINIKLNDFEDKIIIIKNLLKESLIRLIELQEQIKQKCTNYDENFKMILQMKDKIGPQYNDLNISLDRYIDDVIKKNNMLEFIDEYKTLLIECNILKNCITKYHNSQITKDSNPVCKICMINDINIVCIPCGHTVCSNCLTFYLLPFNDVKKIGFYINPLNSQENIHINNINTVNDNNNNNISLDNNIHPQILRSGNAEQNGRGVERSRDAGMPRIPSLPIYKAGSKCSFCRQSIKQIYNIFF